MQTEGAAPTGVLALAARPSGNELAMSGVSLPVTRPSGRALVVANPAGRAEPLATMQRMGYGCSEADDPYAAMAELCRRPLVYRAVILSLSSIHREELAFIPGVKRRFPHVEIWLTHTDGRQSALAEAMRAGADGLLSGEGLHRVAVQTEGFNAYLPGPAVELPSPPPPRAQPAVRPAVRPAVAPAPTPAASDDASGPHDARPDEESNAIGEPVLTADELRALLQEQPLPPPVGNSD